MSQSSSVANDDVHQQLQQLLDVPLELSAVEYADLVEEIRHEYYSDDNVTDECCGQELLDAARSNDIDVVRALLKVHSLSALSTAAAANASANNNNNNTALHMAAANGHVNVISLLLAVEALESAEAAAASSNSNTSNSSSMVHAVNSAGNTALHWAAANGHEEAVKALLLSQHPPSQRSTTHNMDVDVLLKNKAGRSILTEGFSSSNQNVIELLLSHDSASEERLMSSSSTGATATTTTTTTNAKDDGTDSRIHAGIPSNNGARARDENDDSSSVERKAASSVTHHFSFGRHHRQHPHRDQGGAEEAVIGEEAVLAVGEEEEEEEGATIDVRIRELAIAVSDSDSILGQARPEDDTTGLGIWAASLVTAQWMAHLLSHVVDNNKNNNNNNNNDNNNTTESLFTNKTVLELGAGCGVPGLVVAKAAAAAGGGVGAKAVYLTDFNPNTVANLQHNIEMNHLDHHHHQQQQLESSEPPPSSSSSSNAAAAVAVNVKAFVMNWQDESTWPEAIVANRVDVLIGSDLVYQSDMVHTLLQTVWKLRPRRFLYCAGADRCGHAEFIRGMLQPPQGCSESGSGAAAPGRFELAGPPSPAPAHYTQNPLASGDDEDCLVHFHELVLSSSAADSFTLYDFCWIPF